MKKNLPYSQRLAQFKAEAKRVNRLLASGEFYQLAETQRHRMVARLRRFYQELSRAVAGRTLRRVLASATLLLGMGVVSQGHAQIFTAPVNQPFNTVSVYYNATPDMVDIDNDGDLDLFVGEYGDTYGGLQYFENIGTATSPNFAAPVYNPWGVTPTNKEFHPRLVDIDNDGDYDMFAGEYGGDMMFFENTGTATVPAFAAQLRNPFNLTSCNNQAFLSFPDLDNDGDFDLMAGEVGGTLQYFENIGSDTMPAFGPSFPNPFGLSDVFGVSMPEMADLDLDGDLDLLVGESNGNEEYFENTGTASAPAFAPPVSSPYGIVAASANAVPEFADVDGDGDLDLWLGVQDGTLAFQENRAIVSAAAALDGFARVTVYPNPTADLVTVDLESDQAMKDLRAELYDATGRVIATQEKSNSSTDVQFRFDLRDYAAGTYLLRLRSGDRTQVERIVRD